jgi:hypothetical protein
MMTPISSSALSEATIMALAVDDVTTIEALLPMSRLELHRIPGIGRKSVVGINELLRAHITQTAEPGECRAVVSRSATRWTGRLPCVKCSSEAHLMRITPAEPGIRVLTYECTVCEHFNIVRAESPSGPSERPVAT